MAATKQRAKPTATARLVSPLLRGAAAACEIRAWYLLWGSGLNQAPQPLLTLELRQGNRTVRLWQSPPGATHSWQELVAYTGPVPGSFQVTSSSTQGSSSAAQLALDDVEFRNCGSPPPQLCGPEVFHCRQGSCIGTDRVCDGTADCRAGEDEAAAECGFFVYVDPTQKLELPEGRAWLSSPTLGPALDAAQPCSLVFYLHLHGSNGNGLHVYSQTEGALQLAWSRTGDLGPSWFREKVDLVNTKNFTIVIEGRTGSGQGGSIALDDLRLSPGCRTVPEGE